MACNADLETIDDEIEESTSTVEQASQSSDRFFSIRETSSMDEGFNSFEHSTMNTTDKFFTPKKTESTTDLPDGINSVESKSKEIAKSLQHFDFSAISARHSTPQKSLNKTASCQDIKRRLDQFSPVKSHSLENEIDTPYPYTNTDLGLSPRAIRSNADVFKAFFENYTYDTFKQVMKIMKKSHMTAAEAKLRMVIDEMEKAINKCMKDCTEPIAIQMLRHINERKRFRNQSLKADATVKDHEEDVAFRSNADVFKKVMKKMKISRMTAAETNLKRVIDEMKKAINKSMEDSTETIATQVLRHINETKILKRSLNVDVTVNDQEEDNSQKPSKDAKEDNVSQNSSNDNEEISKVESDIKTIPVPKGEELLLKDNVNRFSLKWKRNNIQASDSDKVTRNLTYQILTDFQTLAGIASYNTTLDSSILNDRNLIKQQIRYRYSAYANTQNGQKFIRKHIHINEQIIKQITKLMKFAYKRQPNFLGSFTHLEGERIFLLAKTRRNALLNNLYKVPKPVNEAPATIILEKLACRIIISENLNRLSLNKFFLCILEHKDTVYSTTATVLNTRGWIDFEGRFIFENVSNSFNIKISVYSSTIKTAKPSCVNLTFLRRRPQLPMMSLIGVAEVGLLNAKYRTFSLRNAENVLRPEYKLYAAVGVNLNWPSAFKTFLTVGSTRTDKEPTWTRKWCVLEDGQMNFYTSPADEIVSDPVKIVDVRECQSVKVSPIKYYNTSALMLMFNDDPENKFFLSADTEDDVCVLFDLIKGILKLKDQWIKLKK